MGRWNDRRGGIPLYFSQTNTSWRPTFQMEGVNGRRSVGFSAASSQFLRTEVGFFSVNASTQATLFVIARPTSGSAGGTHRIFGRTVNTNDYELGLSRQDDDPGKLAAWSGKSGVLAQRAYDDQVTAAGTVVAMAGVWKNQTISFYRDGERITSTAIGATVAGATTNLKGWTLGGIEWNGTPTWFASVDVAEFLLFDRA